LVSCFEDGWLVNFGGCDVGLFVVDSDLRRQREETFGPAKRFLGGLKSKNKIASIWN
jgi:hypothetical protein